VFAAHEIQVVSLKGPALRYTLYGDAALRSSSDLDLLVRPEDVLRANTTLEGAGYYMQSILPSDDDKDCLQPPGLSDNPLAGNQRPDDLLFVDLHWRAPSRLLPAIFDERELWGSLREVSVAGTTVSTLSPEQLAAIPQRARHEASLGAAGLALRHRQAGSSRGRALIGLEYLSRPGTPIAPEWSYSVWYWRPSC